MLCISYKNLLLRPKMVVLWVLVLVVLGGLIEDHGVNGHGMMLDPPGRSSMWRLGFNTPKNYDDNGLNCGGRSVIYLLTWNL